MVNIEYRSKEFATGVPIVLTIPPQDLAIITQHAARVSAHHTQLNAKIINPEAQQTAINVSIAANPVAVACSNA